MGVFDWIERIRRLGIRQDSHDETQRRIAFSNVVFMTLPIVYLTFILIDIESYLIPISRLKFDQFIVPIVILICMVCLWLNHLGKSTISRIVFIASWPFLLHIIPIVQLNSPSDYALAFPFGIVFHAMLIQLFFSYRKEWKLFGFFLIVNFVTMLFAPNILISNDSDGDIPASLVNDQYYFLVLVLYWMLFNLVTFYILNLVERSIVRLLDSNKLIETQKEKLNHLNLHLEELVAQRTALLEEQNEKLRQHAFFNAHLLRSPFSNIQGLIQMQNAIEKEKSPEHEVELKLVRDQLNQSIEELDMRIIEIQKLVATSS